MKTSILNKILSLSILSLLAVGIPITISSTESFEEVSRLREEFSNMETALAKADQVRSLMVHMIEKSQNLANLYLKNTTGNPLSPEATLQHSGTLNKSTIEQESSSDFFAESLKNDADWLNLQIWELPDLNGSWQLKKEILQPQLSTPLKLLVEDAYDAIEKAKGEEGADFAKVKRSLPHQEQLARLFSFLMQSPLLAPNVQSEKRVIAQGFPYLGTVPMLRLLIPIGQDRKGQINRLAISYFSLQKFLTVFSSSSEKELLLLDPRGLYLAGTENGESSYNPQTILRTHPLMILKDQEAVSQKQTLFINPADNASYIGAIVDAGYGLNVISQVNEQVVLEPSEMVRKKAFYILGIVFSILLFIVFWFSMGLSKPIEVLAEIMGKVKGGDFSQKVGVKVGGFFKDEVTELATTFDEMVDGLIERDKVKTLFSKFHGSDVAKELIQKEVTMHGVTKEVTVFFSDVRGFTAFSEGHTPEEVVEMLNEYFAIMVRIINKNHGIVDKFIGDAIMAVWGAPKSTGKDAYWCIKSCLEMRLALSELNATRIARGQPPIMIGMGVHSGSAISGTIGSEERMEYTVIGDTVNQTSRIESSTKAFGTDLLISDTTQELIKEDFLFEFAGEAEVKGKTEPLKLYKVGGYIENGIPKPVETPYSSYEKGDADKVKVNKQAA